jgi:hypothetical protein
LHANCGEHCAERVLCGHHKIVIRAGRAHHDSFGLCRRCRHLFSIPRARTCIHPEEVRPEVSRSRQGSTSR